jgi:hypothetical protein
MMTAALTLHIVGFCQIDRDDAVGMAGHHRRTGRYNVGQKFKRQSAWAFGLSLDRKAQLKQRVEQAVLCDFQGPPFLQIVRP